MRFLIAGFGSVGRRHMRNLLALGEKEILLYRSGRSTLPLDEIEGFRVFTDLQAALEARPDAVIVTNPSAFHLEIAIPAAKAGCHILLEKPVSHNMERVDALQSALREGGGQVLVGFQYRFHPSVRRVAAWLQEGAIGRPLSMRAHYGDYMPGWHPWEDYRQTYSARPEMGGGAILTLCHPLDYMRWLIGEVSSVWAFSHNQAGLGIEVEDGAEIGLRFASGVIGSAHLDFYQRPPSYRFEIIGSEGSLTWDQGDNAARLYRAAEGAWQVEHAPAGFERNDMFLDEMRHFLAVARGEAQPLCTLEDGVRVLQVALAAHQSARQGQEVKL